MLWYENIQPTVIYDNIDSLLQDNPDLYKNESVVFCVNGDSGFGSQLSLLVQVGLYLQSINPNIHCLGCFCINGNNFKYHDETKTNSFFSYFRYIKHIDTRSKQYFVKTINVIDRYPFIQSPTIDGCCVNDIKINKQYFTFFRENFNLRIGDDITSNIKIIKDTTDKPLIGLHIRSILQTITHGHVNNSANIIHIMNKIKNTLDTNYKKYYNVFFATDVSSYIDIICEIFKNTNVQIYYNSFISRINNHIGEKHTGPCGYNDSIVNLEQHTGFKLGSDILYDCLSLINCDFYYVSATNVAFIAGSLTDKNNGIHFI